MTMKCNVHIRHQHLSSFYGFIGYSIPVIGRLRTYFSFQFLKKVQRQERAVEEIKMVLKPHYNRKKIDKDIYKEILRKCVPKVKLLLNVSPHIKKHLSLYTQS